MKKILLILSFFVSYSAYAQYVPKAGNKLNVKPNGILVPTSSADDTPIARLEVFASGVSTIKPTALPIASASLLGAFRVGTGLSIDINGILSTVGGSAPDTTIYRTVANSRSLAQTQTALNAKQNNITLTTTGTSGAATLIGSTLNIPNYATGGGGGSYVDLTTNQSVGGVKTFTADNLYIDGGTGTQKMFGFSGADVNPNFKGVYDFDGGYSGFQSGTSKGVQVFGYWGVTIQGNTQNNTPNTTALITGGATDPSLRVIQTTNTAPIVDLKAAASTSGDYLSLSTSAGNANVLRIKSTGALTLPLVTASSVLKLNASNEVVPAVSNTDFLPVASPTMTGTPVAPTPGSNINTTQIPTTAWTNTYYAAKASPTFTGTPAAPTASAKTSTTQIATTAFVGKQFTATGSGTGAATTISFAHGVTGVTSANSVIVTPNNAAAAGLIYVTLDATNVNVVYSVAPASGTNNLAYSVSIK